MYRGVKYQFPKVVTLRKLPGFCGYGCIKRDKTDRTASILMKYSTLVVKILLKHKIIEVLYFWVKKNVFNT